MARKSSNKPLEWVGWQRIVVATDAAPVNTEVVLGLRDDEVAEIHRIEYVKELLLAATTTGARVDLAIGMDPDLDDAPGAIATTEDLEVFHSDCLVLNPLQAIADVDTIYKGSEYIGKNMDPPILVGTNVGISSQFTWLTADGTGSLMGKLFFTRRKANVAELNQILLKRR